MGIAHLGGQGAAPVQSVLSFFSVESEDTSECFTDMTLVSDDTDDPDDPDDLDDPDDHWKELILS